VVVHRARILIIARAPEGLDGRALVPCVTGIDKAGARRLRAPGPEVHQLTAPARAEV
jgi:hypothetical protein